jgi:hypothetical protein
MFCITRNGTWTNLNNFNIQIAGWTWMMKNTLKLALLNWLQMKEIYRNIYKYFQYSEFDCAQQHIDSQICVHRKFIFYIETN